MDDWKTRPVSFAIFAIAYNGGTKPRQKPAETALRLRWNGMESHLTRLKRGVNGHWAVIISQNAAPNFHVPGRTRFDSHLPIARHTAASAAYGDRRPYYCGTRKVQSLAEWGASSWLAAANLYRTPDTIQVPVLQGGSLLPAANPHPDFSPSSPTRTRAGWRRPDHPTGGGRLSSF